MFGNNSNNILAKESSISKGCFFLDIGKKQDKGKIDPIFFLRELTPFLARAAPAPHLGGGGQPAHAIPAPLSLSLPLESSLLTSQHLRSARQERGRGRGEGFGGEGKGREEGVLLWGSAAVLESSWREKGFCFGVLLASLPY